MKLNRISLNTIGLNRIGLNRIGSPSRGSSSGSNRPYIDPEVLASLVAVVKCDGKSNNDPDRAIIKNLVDPDNPFVISNAAYKLNSGFGKYEEDFTSWIKYPNVETDGFNIWVNPIFDSDWLLYRSVNTSGINATKIRVTGIPQNGAILYHYIKNSDDVERTTLIIEKDGIYELPESFIIKGSTITVGFQLRTPKILDYTKIKVEQIPSFQGALVTDGVDDLIVSQKTVQEMLGGSNEITVVSMIHHITGTDVSSFNSVRNFTGVTGRNRLNINNNPINKTGIYGWSRSNLNTVQATTMINNVLGDNKDYQTINNDILSNDSIYSVEGYNAENGAQEVSQVAWYWTFIANRVLTSDEINQVIAYYNLDKYVKPDIYNDVKKQGLSNDTPDADWYLKDFSGNGRDMQLYNFAKKLGSGVGKYAEDFKTWYQMTNGTAIISHNKLRVNKVSDINGGNFIAWKQNDIKAFKARITGVPKDTNILYLYSRKGSAIESIAIDTDGEYDLPYSHSYTSGVGFAINSNFPREIYIGVTIEQIPDYEGALVFDAVEDYGQFVGDLGLKDYTVAVDRAYPSLKGNGVPVISNIKRDTATPFLFEFADNTSVVRPYSFGATTVLSPMELSRKISYQSTYIYDGTAINKGLYGNTGDGLTIGRFGIDTQYANIALWSLLLFPYTLSEFLLERQLKRYKLGTLYPNMLEFRPIVKSNVEYELISFATSTSLVDKIVAGYYMKLGTLYIHIKPKSDNDRVIDVKINGIPAKLEGLQSNGQFRLKGEVTKSPQKIDITIDEYIRYEDIVQPYPFIIPIIDTDGKEYTYGDKIKVGTEIRGGINGNNLLPELYKLNGYFNFNGAYFSASNKHVIGKTNVFELTNAPTYLKANEPNCIADPQRLRIPNSSYKILGYIPDISGHGNHLKINNSAYAGMSGANGYNVDWNSWYKSSSIIATDSKITLAKNISALTYFCYTNQSSVPGYKVNISGIPDGGRLNYGGVLLHNGINELVGIEGNTNSFGFRFDSISDWSNLVIEQIGEYEGSFCLDGVDDFITIPTLSHGAKQVLMKVNNQKLGTLIFDERINGTRMFINSQNDTLAYDGSDVCYIDGIRNLNIKTNDLLNVTHNITCSTTNTDMGTPVIGKYKAGDNYYAQMALFAFMSFDEISSEDEIKELNDIVGIEGGYVESPDYYFDAYGKSNNLDEDIDYQGSGTANTKWDIYDKSITGLQVLEDYRNGGSIVPVRNRQLTLNNFAFNEESGYGGWLGIGNLTTALNYRSNTTTNNWKRGGTFLKGLNRNTGIGCGYALANWFDNANHILKFKVKITGLIDTDELYICQYNVDDSKIKQQLFNGINEVTLDTSTSSVPGYRYITFRYPPLTNDVDFEFLYEYQNGLVSDGVEDNLKNTNMPVLTDYTWIMKRKRLNDKSSTTLCHKGNGSNSNAFLFEYIEGGKATRSFGLTTPNIIFPDLISYQTKNSYNGQTINSGTSEDGNALHIFMGSNSYPYYTKAVFYKAMLYSKTIDMLSINMLKNLFAKDELIDVNNPIFKK